jgi:hypothetical protein
VDVIGKRRTKDNSQMLGSNPSGLPLTGMEDASGRTCWVVLSSELH